ncbi:unnamed protein product [Malus baccata var. baccata]
MTQGLLPWSPCHHSLSPTSLFSLPLAFPITKHTQFPLSISATLEPATAGTQHLTARERRQLRNERRESKTGTSWKEEVEEKLLEKPTKKFANWKEELNLNNLAHEGPQWWIIKVSRVKGQETAQLIARLLARNYPQIDFKIYAPSIQDRKKLKNGNLVKPRPLFPGCVFIRCVLDKELHDFIRECDGVAGFVGSKVGNTENLYNVIRMCTGKDKLPDPGQFLSLTWKLSSDRLRKNNRKLNKLLSKSSKKQPSMMLTNLLEILFLNQKGDLEKHLILS